MNTKVLFAADISLKSPQLILVINAYMVSVKKQAKKFNIGSVIVGIMATNLEIYSNIIIIFDYLRGYHIQIIKATRM